MTDKESMVNDNGAPLLADLKHRTEERPMTYAPTAYLCRVECSDPESPWALPSRLLVVAASDLVPVRRQRAVREHLRHGAAVRIDCDIRSAERALMPDARPTPATLRAMADAKARLAAACGVEVLA